MMPIFTPSPWYGVPPPATPDHTDGAPMNGMLRVLSVVTLVTACTLFTPVITVSDATRSAGIETTRPL